MTGSKAVHKSGYAAIIGKPNVGKSTLLNHILGTKLSIATHKAQTTRHQILGIYSEDDAQIIFWDTPGLINPKYELQKAMMRFLERAKNDADIIVFMAEAFRGEVNTEALQMFAGLQKPVILVLNKIDLCTQEQAEETAAEWKQHYNFSDVVFISAVSGFGVAHLVEAIKEHLKPGPAFYPKDELSEHPMRFFAAELIREQIFLQYHEEIPYSATVEIIRYEEQDEMDVIHAEIIMTRDSQKGILIGKGGKAIKKLGTAARKAIEDFTGKKVYLDMHVKVRDNWRDKENMVKSLGYKF